MTELTKIVRKIIIAPSGTISVSALFDALSCPVCYHVILSPPVFQCENGHVVCCDCHKRLTVCHTCRQPQGEIRNRALESLMASFPYQCRFEIYGCEESMTKENLADHEKQCPFREVFYPSLAFTMELSLPKLMYVFFIMDEKKTSISLKVGKPETIKLPMNVIRPNDEWTPVHVRFNDEDFFFLFVERSGFYHAGILFAGSVEYANRYYCSIQFYKNRRQKLKNRISGKGLAISLEVDFAAAVKEANFEEGPLISCSKEQAAKFIKKNVLKAMVSIEKI